MPSPLAEAENPRRLVLVTGPSGAGRSTAIHVLEDIGFEAIDNLPLSLLPRLFAGPGLDTSLALGIDVRNRDFSTCALLEVIDGDAARAPGEMEVLYLDCRPDILVRRFSETRRRHPLSPEGSPEDGIARERDLLGPVRARSDILVDTSDMSPHDLRAELERWFAPAGAKRLSVSVQSFSYKRGLPRGLDMVFDCRFLDNPHWQPDLRAADGRDAAVQAFLRDDPRLAPFLDRLNALLDLLLPAHEDEGRAYLAIGTGCTGGQHRSVAVAEFLRARLAQQGWPVSLRHRELERREPGEGRS
ncbi:RNase adapter RapZ [Roseovarius ramblicola]|uniref:RNase adapter RapZ n=1 Tax=Roseovarius ramblicola TaxID=2022336 RepID=A0ABV5HV96_9RHOB